VIGAAYSAWDGYIVGRNLELEPNRRIVQSWRTSEFAVDDPDSTVTIVLTPLGAGTRLELRHAGVPDAQTTYENGGWRDFYLEPMQAYFGRRAP
jgi:activator of HSP90 ATPase